MNFKYRLIRISLEMLVPFNFRSTDKIILHPFKERYKNENAVAFDHIQPSIERKISITTDFKIL